MTPCLIGLVLTFGPPASAAVIAVASLSRSLSGLGSVPAIGATALPPALSMTSLGSPLSVLPARTAAPIKDEDRSKSLDAAAASARFDGGRAAAPGPDWTLGVFQGDGGAPLYYKTRAGTGGAPARVYAGGLALTESFEPLFAREEKPAGNEIFVWTRAHAPSKWRATKSPLDADARDLARAVVIAAAASPGGQVELVLHSFATLIFQRMVQLHAEPAVAAALKALAGSRVFLLQATTHYEGSEKRAGRDFERMGQAARAVIDWLNAGDATAELWKAAARMNPFLAPASAAWVELWRFQRGQLVALAARDAGAMMRADLKEPWDQAVDHIRRAFLKDLEADTQDPGWQEALLRRSSDMFRLEFAPEDTARINKLGLLLELVHSDGDMLLNWESARVLFERLGIEAPEKAPPSGAVLTDKTGRLRARIVTGDHYFPLKRRDELAEILKP